jgi:anti-sigma-K factor RskA
LFTTPDARVTVLAGLDAAPRARATLAYDRRTGRTQLYTYNLPPAPVGKAYQLWFIADGRPLPGKVFKTDAQGHASLRDQAPANLSDATVFAVTLEPEGGVSAPTGSMYLKGNAS